MKVASSSQISPGFADGWLMTGGFVSGGTVVGEGPGDVVGTGAGDVVGGDVGEGGVVVAPGVVVPGLVGEVGLVDVLVLVVESPGTVVEDVDVVVVVEDVVVVADGSIAAVASPSTVTQLLSGNSDSASSRSTSSDEIHTAWSGEDRARTWIHSPSSVRATAYTREPDW
jgi:hypothetical protein